RFAPPSEAHNEIRNDCRWLDALVLRCLEADPARRFADAGQLLAAIDACEAGGELPPAAPPAQGGGPARKAGAEEGAAAELFRETRRLLANRAYEQVIDRLDVHRPAEWAAHDARAGRTLRLLGQAYLGRGDLTAARDCLEQLRAAQHEQAVLPGREYAAALTDLVRCYRALGRRDLADGCQEEARRLAQG